METLLQVVGRMRPDYPGFDDQFDSAFDACGEQAADSSPPGRKPCVSKCHGAIRTAKTPKRFC
jgi:hypothetical protein